MTITLDQFVECVVKSGTLTTDELEAYLTSLPPDKQPQNVQELVQGLCQKGLLTRFQAQALSEGKSAGLILDDYILLDKIGQGGMGVVYKAKHRRMKRVVALKVLSKTAMACERSVKRFYREVEASARLTHPNIVAAHDAREARGIHYMVMEYIEGDSLADLVSKQGILSTALVVDMMAQAAQGLAYAHHQGMVHRDIKPGNLILNTDGVLKVLDLGLVRMDAENLSPRAEANGGLTKSNHMMGTPDYMAPEQALNPKHADNRSDIYALGCTMYRLLTGHVPYAGETTVERVLAHQNAPLPLLRQFRSDVPEELESIFHRMIAKQPADRYQSMDDVVSALQSLKLKLPQHSHLPQTNRNQATVNHTSINRDNLAEGATQITPNSEHSSPTFELQNSKSSSSQLGSLLIQDSSASGSTYSSDSLVKHPSSSEAPMESWTELLAQVPTLHPQTRSTTKSRKGSRDKKTGKNIDPMTKWLLMGATAIGVFLMGVMGLMVLRSGRNTPIVAQITPNTSQPNTSQPNTTQPNTPASNNTPGNINPTPSHPAPPAVPVQASPVISDPETPTTPVDNPPQNQPPTTTPPTTPISPPADPSDTYPYPSPPPKVDPAPANNIPPLSVPAVAYKPAQDLLKDFKLPLEFGRSGWRIQGSGMYAEAIQAYPDRPLLMEVVERLPEAYRLTLEVKAIKGAGHLFVIFSANNQQYALPIRFDLNRPGGPSKRGGGNFDPRSKPGFGKGPPPENGPRHGGPPPAKEMELAQNKVATFEVTVHSEGLQVTRDGIPGLPQGPPLANEFPPLPQGVLNGNNNLLIGTENCSFLISRLTLEPAE